MPNKHFAIDIDEFCEEVHGELASVQDGGAGHYCRIDAESLGDATDKLLERLHRFVSKRFYESDDYGYRLENTDAK